MGNEGNDALREDKGVEKAMRDDGGQKELRDTVGVIWYRASCGNTDGDLIKIMI